MAQDMQVQINILFGVEKNCMRRVSIPSCPSNLLVVVNDIQRQVEVEHQTNIWHVYTHTKGCGGNHDTLISTDEAQFMLFPLVRFHVSMTLNDLMRNISLR